MSTGHAVWRPAGSRSANDPGELIEASGDAWRVLAWQLWDHPSAPGQWTRIPLAGYELSDQNQKQITR